MNKKIGIRVDVDFEIDLIRGIPFLLDLFKEHGVKATFFVTMGPDGFGYNRRRVKSVNYIQRILSLNPFKIVRGFGLFYLIKQILGIKNNVGASHPDILEKIVSEGHELGVHGFDHYQWAENVWCWNKAQVEEDIKKAAAVFRDQRGVDPEVWASPNWRCSEDSLQFIDGFNNEYSADTRGKSPFFPTIGDWKAKTVQLPINLPCLHEVKQFLKTNDENSIIQYVFSHFQEHYNILCIHGYYEGILARHLFKSFLQEALRKGHEFVPLNQIAKEVKPHHIKTCKLTKKKLSGGRGEVSWQGEET